MPEINAEFRKDQEQYLITIYECRKNLNKLIKKRRIKIPRGKFQRKMGGGSFTYKLNYILHSDKYCDSTKKEVRTISKTYLENRNKVVENNYRLVCDVAKEYRGEEKELDDLIQEGSKGLIRTLEKFNPTKGYQFSTYATPWIKQYIARGVKDGMRIENIRIPMHMHDFFSKYKKTVRQFVNEIGIEPNTEELAKILKVSQKRVLEIQIYLNASAKRFSLDSKIRENEDLNLYDSVHSKEKEDKEPDFLNEKDQLRFIIEKYLTKKEKRVISLRYGLKDGSPRTLAKIGKTIRLTRERVRQIEEKAIKKIRRRRYQTEGLGTRIDYFGLLKKN